MLVELGKKYKLEPTQAIIRHYDVTEKVCPKYYVEDVGAFKKLREEVQDKMSKAKELVEAVKVLQKKGIISSLKCGLRESIVRGM